MPTARPKKRLASRTRRASTSTIQFESIEKTVRHPDLDGDAVVVLKSGKKVLLSKDELRESARQMLVRELKTPEHLRKISGRRKGKLGDDPFVVEVGRHVVRHLHDLALEATREVSAIDQSVADAIADHVWSRFRAVEWVEIAGELRVLNRERYLVPAAIVDGFPEDRWDEARPRFRSAVKAAIQRARAESYGRGKRGTAPPGRRWRKKLANLITIYVLAEFGRTLSDRSLCDVLQDSSLPPRATRTEIHRK